MAAFFCFSMIIHAPIEDAHRLMIASPLSSGFAGP